MFSEQNKMTAVAGASAAAQTEVDGSIIDMTGWDGVIFIAVLGQVSANGVDTLNIQQSTANSAGGMAAIPGATTVFTDSGAGTAGPSVIAIDLYRPQQRFLRPQLLRTVGNTVLDSIVAIQYSTARRPVVQDVSVIAITKIAPVA